MFKGVRVAEWDQYAWLRHGFSTRLGGVSTVYGSPSLNLGWTKEDDPAHVAENRQRLVNAVGAEGKAITLRQVHGVAIQTIRDANSPFENTQGRALLEGDGLMTNLPGVLLGIQTADCVPVILVDVERRAVAVLHAGWRGTAAGMVEHGVAAMQREYGSHPENLVAAIGPSIGPCCYTVGDEVHQAFVARYPYADELFQDDRLNLWQANRHQLIDAGIPAAQVTIIGECTGCSVTAKGQRRFFSHRIDQGVTGRMMSLVGIARP